MIYVNLMGGLGNQLFQYAFAQYLRSAGVSVDGLVANTFETDPYGRQLELAEVSSLPVIRIEPARIPGCTLLREEQGEQLRAQLARGVEAEETVVCVGYWQDARYADAVRELLLAQLAPRQPTGESAPCLLHVRRRDYGHHGLLPLGYYQSALEAAGWPTFQVVTDEPNFCGHVFRDTRGYQGVWRTPQVGGAWADLHALAGARIQVIANSSFSWWSAWLGQALGHTRAVYAPSQWSLLVPESPAVAAWTRIECRLQQP